MPGSPPPFETRAVTRTGSDCMWAAVVSPASEGSEGPREERPLGVGRAVTLMPPGDVVDRVHDLLGELVHGKTLGEPAKRVWI